MLQAIKYGCVIVGLLTSGSSMGIDLDKNLPKLQVVTEEWLPYNYTDEQGNIIGRATNKVKSVLDDAGLDYEIRVYPWLRAMKLATEQPNTLIYSIFRTPERENLFHWVCPLLEPIREYLFKLKSRTDIHVVSVDDAKKYITAIVRGSVGYNFLLEQGFKAGGNLDVSADPLNIPKKLVAGRVDLVMTTEFTLSESLKLVGASYELVERLIEVRAIDSRRACMAFSLNTDPQIITAVSNALMRYNDNPLLPKP